MLSKVLDEATADAQPLSWRRSVPIRTAAAQPVDSAAPDEILQLRARLTEMHAAGEQQARQSYEAGLRAGEGVAKKALESETRAVVDRLAATIADVASARSDAIRRAEADTVRLAVEIARRVLHRELSVDPNALEALAKAALNKLQSQEIRRVRVHPDQEELLRASLRQTGRGKTIEVVADPSQPPGGILFDIGRGMLDASVNTQLDEIARGLADQLDARQ
jgi:flagellar assembly protein FliH